MAWCKRCALKGEKGKGKKKKKRGKTEEKIGIKIVFFLFVFCFVFYKSVRMFFHMRSGHFSNV